jgi:hypothetical protein
MFGAIFGAVSAIGGVIGQASQASQAKKINQSIQEQISLEKQSYDLLKRQRNVEKRDTTFQFMRERELYRLQANSAIQESYIQDAANQVNFLNQALTTQQQAFQVYQDRQLKEQSAQQERGATVAQSNQVIGQAAEQGGKIKQATAQGNVAAAQLGQTGSQSDLTRLAANNLAQSSTDQSRLGTVNDISATAEQDYAANSRLFDANATLGVGALNTQLALNNQALTSSNALSQGNRGLINTQREMFNKSLRANKIAEGVRQGSQSEADRLTNQANIARLEAGMQPSNGLANLFGAAAQLGSAAYGIYNAVSPAQYRSPQTQGLYGTSNPGNLGANNGVGGVFSLANQQLSNTGNYRYQRLVDTLPIRTYG